MVLVVLWLQKPCIEHKYDENGRFRQIMRKMACAIMKRNVQLAIQYLDR